MAQRAECFGNSSGLYQYIQFVLAGTVYYHIMKNDDFHFRLI
jgi:hypothetical protein